MLAYTVHITSGGPSTFELSYDEASVRYDDLLRRAETLRNRLEIPEKDWNEAYFAVSALMDEMILCSAWPGRDAWQTAQFQHRVFNTTNAGAEFFEHLSTLGPGKEDIREVYDWCLAMGFKGAYFRPEDSGDLEEITKQNKALLRRQGTDPDVLHMFPDAYGADRRDRRKGISGLLVFTIISGIVPILLFIGLYIFYSNILNGILAVYFQ
ncbi:MAG: tssL [Deltaproteobacteria bacterium]|nr:tssL [Deltaproteobacteria bacterium]